jgi:hypothetical protein
LGNGATRRERAVVGYDFWARRGLFGSASSLGREGEREHLIEIFETLPGIERVRIEPLD